MGSRLESVQGKARCPYAYPRGLGILACFGAAFISVEGPQLFYYYYTYYSTVLCILPLFDNCTTPLPTHLMIRY